MIVLGRIAAPYGVRGWLRLHPFGDDPAGWRSITQWWLGADPENSAAWRAYVPQTLRPHGREWLLKLTGVDDRAAAEALVGHYVGAPRAALPPTGDDEYYWADLVGLEVVNERDEKIGRVAELIESGAHAVLVVAEDEGERRVERLLPFVGKVVKDVDVSAGRIRVDWERDW